jgi:two-component sensor histidine kinase
MSESDFRRQLAPATAAAGSVPPGETLAAENVSLRLLLEQAEINAQALLAQAGIDARERDASDRLQKLILGELHHRIQNTLATVSAIVSQSLWDAPSIQHAKAAIEGRLQALGRAHDLLLQARLTSAPLEKVVRAATEAFDNPDRPRFSIEGPNVEMTSAAVIAVAMTLNELCTNTTKFGALSVPAGRVDVGWTVDQASQRLHLNWTERDGPPVETPIRHSFGTRMIETLGQQLRGIVELRYSPAGFVYVLDVPMASLKTLPAE